MTMSEQITTAAELDALPVGSVVLSRNDAVWRRVAEEEFEGGYRFESIEYEGRHQAVTFERLNDLPATVLYRPDRTEAERTLPSEDRVQRMILALTEQRVIDSRKYGVAPYAPITRADAVAALCPKLPDAQIKEGLIDE